MRVDEFLADASHTLHTASIETARLDCLILLEDELGVDRAQLLAHPERMLSQAAVARLKAYISQRATHKPLAYIRGEAPFFGRTFAVDERVLVPRPESETVIELLAKVPLSAGASILDVGTGCGCLGITAALELPDSAVMLSDISDEALAVARRNARSLGAENVTIVRTDLAEACQSNQYDVVLANLPYVPEHYDINRAAGFEPALALFSGPDGLDAYRTFWTQLGNGAYPPKVVITESLPSQHHAVATLARAASYALEQTQDFVQRFAKV